MRLEGRSMLTRWLRLLARSVLAGGVAGVVAAWLIFFVFGFVGMAGAGLADQVSNGWRAANALAVGRGIKIGVGIGAGLAVTAILWMSAVERFEPRRARPWLTAAGASIMVVGNAEVVQRLRDWDPVGVGTVAFMTLLGAGAVWLVSPWVMRPLGPPSG